MGGKVIYLTARKLVATPRKDIGCAHALAQDKIVGFQEAVLGRENGQDIVIELEAQQHDKHAHEVGEKESRELRNTDMLPEEFPNESHKLRVLS